MFITVALEFAHFNQQKVKAEDASTREGTRRLNTIRTILVPFSVHLSVCRNCGCRYQTPGRTPVACCRNTVCASTPSVLRWHQRRGSPERYQVQQTVVRQQRQHISAPGIIDRSGLPYSFFDLHTGWHGSKQQNAARLHVRIRFPATRTSNTNIDDPHQVKRSAAARKRHPTAIDRFSNTSHHGLKIFFM